MFSKSTATKPIETPFVLAYKGYFKGIMRWHELDTFWEQFTAKADAGWYLYAVGETPPKETADIAEVLMFAKEIDALLHKDHEEDFCGIVYVDDAQDPSFVKIFDPNNLGVSCGFSENPPLPGWVASLIPPEDLPAAMPPPASRRRWWQKLSGKN